MRGRSGPQARSSRAAASAIRPGSRLGGRLARSRQSDNRFAAGPSGVADGEAEVAQRGFVGVEAQDFGGGRGALKRQAGAQRPGGGRVAAQTGVEQSEPGAGGKQRIALPCPSARPRPGRDRRRRRKGLPFRGFRRARLGSRALSRAAQERASPRVGEGSASRVEIGANHWRMVNASAALCQLIWRVIRPACRGVGCPISCLIGHEFGSEPGRHAKRRQIRPWSPLGPPRRTLRRRLRGRRGVGKRAAGPCRGAAPPALPLPAGGLRHRSTGLREPPLDPIRTAQRAVASDRVEARDAAGASPAPPPGVAAARRAQPREPAGRAPSPAIPDEAPGALRPEREAPPGSG